MSMRLCQNQNGHEFCTPSREVCVIKRPSMVYCQYYFILYSFIKQFPRRKTSIHKIFEFFKRIKAALKFQTGQQKSMNVDLSHVQFEQLYIENNYLKNSVAQNTKNQRECLSRAPRHFKHPQRQHPIMTSPERKLLFLEQRTNAKTHIMKPSFKQHIPFLHTNKSFN